MVERSWIAQVLGGEWEDELLVKEKRHWNSVASAINWRSNCSS